VLTLGVGFMTPGNAGLGLVEADAAWARSSSACMQCTHPWRAIPGSACAWRCRRTRRGQSFQQEGKSLTCCCFVGKVTRAAGERACTSNCPLQPGLSESSCGGLDQACLSDSDSVVWPSCWPSLQRAVRSARLKNEFFESRL
jgi:hypothetical protein